MRSSHYSIPAQATLGLGFSGPKHSGSDNSFQRWACLIGDNGGAMPDIRTDAPVPRRRRAERCSRSLAAVGVSPTSTKPLNQSLRSVTAPSVAPVQHHPSGRWESIEHAPVSKPERRPFVQRTCSSPRDTVSGVCRGGQQGAPGPGNSLRGSASTAFQSIDIRQYRSTIRR